MDSLKILWDAQAEQQRDLGLDPRNMSEVERRDVAATLLLCLHEEVGELQRVAAKYKKHILASAPVDSGNVASEVADIMKLVISIAQVHGLTVDDVVSAFHSKTNVVKARAQGERLDLRANTEILCVDLDDCVVDLSPWTTELGRLQGSAPPNARTLQMMEAWKDEWYKSGRFRELEPIPGAVEALQELSAAGVRIVIITARPQWQYKRIHADTLEWLQEHQVPHDLILFNKDKVEAIYEHIAPAWPMAFVEDHERNARHLATAGVRVLLYDRPSNQDVSAENITRIHDWSEVLDEVYRLLESRKTWKTAH